MVHLLALGRVMEFLCLDEPALEQLLDVVVDGGERQMQLFCHLGFGRILLPGKIVQNLPGGVIADDLRQALGLLFLQAEQQERLFRHAGEEGSKL